MISKKQRVSHKEVELLFKQGKRLGTPFFNVRYRLDTEVVKCAVIVPKSISKKATTRNSIRRRWYGTLDLFLSKITKGIYVFTLTKEGAVLVPSDRQATFENFFKINNLYVK